MSFYTFVDEPLYSVSEMHRIMDDALHTLNRSVRSGVAQHAAQRAGDGQDQVQRRPENIIHDHNRTRGFQPKMDIHENPETGLVTATFELPGMQKENVTLDVYKSRLVISGETNFAAEKEEAGFVLKERRRGKFSRSLPLPQGIHPEHIKASMENGLLTVTFPKTSPQQEPQKISIA